MIFVDKKVGELPKSLKDNIDIKIDTLLKTKKVEGYYCTKNVTIKLLQKYYVKCCYCEVKINLLANPNDDEALQIDHYRPHGNIKDDNTHQGYYWLGYEWTNLLPSCRKCNNSKRDNFPIKGVRVYTPQSNRTHWKSNYIDYLNEEPYILNPELDYPNKHIYFMDDGYIHSRTYRGKKTIELCKLNRNKLHLKRKEKSDKYLIEIIKYILEDMDNGIFEINNKDKLIVRIETLSKRCFKNIIENLKETEEFSAYVKDIYENFEKFYVKNLRDILKKYNVKNIDDKTFNRLQKLLQKSYEYSKKDSYD